MSINRPYNYGGVSNSGGAGHYDKRGLMGLGGISGLHGLGQVPSDIDMGEYASAYDYTAPNVVNPSDSLPGIPSRVRLGFFDMFGITGQPYQGVQPYGGNSASGYPQITGIGGGGDIVAWISRYKYWLLAAVAAGVVLSRSRGR